MGKNKLCLLKLINLSNGELLFFGKTKTLIS